jgi:hypothetical protein
VSSATASRPLNLRSVRHRKTAFDRNLLPGFTEWLVQQVERWRPDFLIPAETKGARLLDTALAYARDELGTPIEVPVLYASALAYIDPDLLRGCKVMIVDDAVCSGANLNRHRQWIASHGIAEIQALVCVGLDENSDKRRNVECYVNVDRPVYERCIWQLTELVVARGLPPEVDHFVFEGRLPGRLSSAWRELEATLGAYGELTVEGPESKRGRLLPMTLHFPRLPVGAGRAAMPPHNEGPDKLRLFPDPAHNRFFVLPISLPALTLDPGADPEQPLPVDWAKQRIEESLGGPDSVTDMLVDEAEVLHAKTVFRALSSATEFGLIRGFAEVLASIFPGATLVGQQEPFDRLYGRESGERIAVRVRQGVDDALARGAEVAVGEDEPPPLAPEPRFLDSSIAETTRSVAECLKAMYDERDPTELLGLSMPQIAAELDGDDWLEVSRCISFGLAMTTFVPYIDVQLGVDGRFRVERFYRVSENNRGRQQPYKDIDRIHLDKSEQALALICHRIRTRCLAFADSPISEELLTAMVGVLYPLVLEDHDIALCTRPGVRDLEMLLLDGVPPVPFNPTGSTYYDAADGGVVPTEKFLNLYEARRLDLDLDRSTEEIETHVDLLAPFVEQLDEEELLGLMKGWAMSTDRRLGLEHVHASLKAALAELRQPLKLILREQTHDPSAGTASRAGRQTLFAACKLNRLTSNWSEPALERWQRPARREQRLLVSLGAPSSEGMAFYALPKALATLIAALGDVVESLDKASVRYWVDGDQITAAGEKARRQAVGAAINWCTVIRHRLTSLHEEGDTPPIPEQPNAAIVAAAEALLDTLDLIESFVASTAGEFRGEDSERRPTGTASKQRDVSVLSFDIVGATVFGQLHDSEATHRWKEEALDAAAQWTRSFGSWPTGTRRGDEIKVEFDEAGDAAILCAAVVQQHMAALRSTGGEDVGWRFHCAIDCGQVEEGPDNLTGSCLDRSSKLAKLCDGGGETDDIFITKESRGRCSPELREKPLATPLPEVSFDEDEETAVIRPFAIDSAGAMKLWVERLQELGEWIVQAPLKQRASEAPLWFGPDTREEGGESSEGASG